MPLNLKVDYLRVLALFGVVEILVRTRDLPSVLKTLGIPMPSASEGVSNEPLQMASAVWTRREMQSARVAFVISSRLFGLERGCLRRSLVIARLLRARQPNLKIGVRTSESGPLTAHAWLEFRDVAFEDGSGYVPLPFLTTPLASM